MRRAASKIFASLVEHAIIGGAYDTQCGIKGFRAPVAEELFGVARIDRFAFDVEILSIATRRNYRILRVPVVLENNEESSVNILHDSLHMLIDLASIWRANNRQR